MLDIQQGHILVIDGREYPVKAVSVWNGLGNTASIQRLARIDASTKRTMPDADQKIGEPVTYLSGLKVTPLDPVSSELASSAGLGTPHTLLRCFVSDPSGYLQLIVENLHR